MIWGCHANQFADGPFSYGPTGSFTDSSDALGEEWLLIPNRGSIGSLGSSAFEFLNTNSAYNDYVGRGVLHDAAGAHATARAAATRALDHG